MAIETISSAPAPERKPKHRAAGPTDGVTHTGEINVGGTYGIDLTNRPRHAALSDPDAAQDIHPLTAAEQEQIEDFRVPDTLAEELGVEAGPAAPERSAQPFTSPFEVLGRAAEAVNPQSALGQQLTVLLGRLHEAGPSLALGQDAVIAGEQDFYLNTVESNSHSRGVGSIETLGHAFNNSLRNPHDLQALIQADNLPRVATDEPRTFGGQAYRQGEELVLPIPASPNVVMTLRANNLDKMAADITSPSADVEPFKIGFRLSGQDSFDELTPAEINRQRETIAARQAIEQAIPSARQELPTETLSVEAIMQPRPNDTQPLDVLTPTLAYGIPLDGAVRGNPVPPTRELPVIPTGEGEPRLYRYQRVKFEQPGTGIVEEGWEIDEAATDRDTIVLRKTEEDGSYRRQEVTPSQFWQTQSREISPQPRSERSATLDFFKDQHVKVRRSKTGIIEDDWTIQAMWSNGIIRVEQTGTGSRKDLRAEDLKEMQALPVHGRVGRFARRLRSLGGRRDISGRK